MFSAHWLIVLFAYFRAIETMPQLKSLKFKKPVISYLFENSSCLSIFNKLVPYIRFIDPVAAEARIYNKMNNTKFA